MTTSQVTGDGPRAACGEIYLNFRKTKLHRVGQPFAVALQGFKVLKYLHNQPAPSEGFVTGIWPSRKRGNNGLVAEIHDKKLVFLIGNGR
jgi:hypothetical protein